MKNNKFMNKQINKNINKLINKTGIYCSIYRIKTSNYKRSSKLSLLPPCEMCSTVSLLV